MADSPPPETLDDTDTVDSETRSASSSGTLPQLHLESAQDLVELLELYNIHNRQRIALMRSMDQTNDETELASQRDHYHEHTLMRSSVGVVIVDFILENPWIFSNLRVHHSPRGDLLPPIVQNLQEPRLLTEAEPMLHLSAAQVVDDQPRASDILPYISRVIVDEAFLTLCDTSCSICTEDFVSGETLSMLPCGHTYHDSCVGRWFDQEQGPSCPLCRRQLVLAFVPALSRRVIRYSGAMALFSLCTFLLML